MIFRIGLEEMNPILFLGMCSSLIGSLIIVREVIVTKEKAIELSVARWSGATPEINLRLPQAKARLKQSRNAKVGAVFLIVGFLLQFYANL